MSFKESFFTTIQYHGGWNMRSYEPSHFECIADGYKPVVHWDEDIMYVNDPILTGAALDKTFKWLHDNECSGYMYYTLYDHATITEEDDNGNNVPWRYYYYCIYLKDEDEIEAFTTFIYNEVEFFNDEEFLQMKKQRKLNRLVLPKDSDVLVVREWCDRNCSGRFRVREPKNRYNPMSNYKTPFAQFHNYEDEVAFKMRWL